MMPLTAPRQAAREVVRHDETRNETRALYLDGLRGLAAIQIVMSHYSDFPLGLSGDIWRKSSLFFVIDGFGYGRVYLLFVLSGFVLTIAYGSRPTAVLASIAQRLVRLGLPMLVALLFAAALLAISSKYNFERTLGLDRSSSFFAVLHTTYSAAEALKQAGTTGMLIGYREATILPDMIRNAIFDQSNGESLDPPLWTLHFEFWGSVFIIGLVALSRRIKLELHLFLIAVLAIIFSRHTFLTFLVGHAFALSWRKQVFRHLRASLFWHTIGVVAALGAVWASGRQVHPWIEAWWAVPLPLQVYAPFNLQGLYAALLCFASVMLLPALQRLLVLPPLQWLGRISFGLYLLHFPILHTVTLAVFALSSSRMSIVHASLLSTLVGITISIAAATAFQPLIDQPSIRIGRWVWSRVAGSTERVDARAVAATGSRPTS